MLLKWFKKGTKLKAFKGEFELSSFNIKTTELK